MFCRLNSIIKYILLMTPKILLIKTVLRETHYFISFLGFLCISLLRIHIDPFKGENLICLSVLSYVTGAILEWNWEKMSCNKFRKIIVRSLMLVKQMSSSSAWLQKKHCENRSPWQEAAWHQKLDQNIRKRKNTSLSVKHTTKKETKGHHLIWTLEIDTTFNNVNYILVKHQNSWGRIELNNP